MGCFSVIAIYSLLQKHKATQTKLCNITTLHSIPANTRKACQPSNKTSAHVQVSVVLHSPSQEISTGL